MEICTGVFLFLMQVNKNKVKYIQELNYLKKELVRI